MNQTQYTHNDIKVLGQIEAVRKNRGMYIGDATNPNHLMYELLDNALDEVQAGYATVIGVEINNTECKASVADNGRGIPFLENTIERVCTLLHSGGKFDKGDTGVYKIACGLHGVGIVAVNAFSDYMNVSVYRDNKHALINFVDSKPVKKEIKDHIEQRPYSTLVEFKPTKQYFEECKFDITPIKNRLRLACVHLPKLKVVFIADGKKEIISCNLNTFFNEEFSYSSIKNKTDLFEFNHSVKDENIFVRFFWDFDSTVNVRSVGCVNLLSVNVGTHISYFNDMMKSIFSELADKNKIKIKDSDALIGLKFYISLSMYTPEYSSQIKDRLSTTRQKMNHLFEPIKDKITKQLTSNEDLLLKLLTHFNSYRKKLDARENIVKTGNKVTRYSCNSDSKIRDCSSHHIEHCELFITEGQSASGGLTQCRDTKIHAILGLRGKISNIADDKKDFLKNKEIIEIVNALGTGIEPDFNKDGLRYGKIIISTDADPDGSHIASLLLTVFLKLTPKLFDMGVIYVAKMPLYGATVNGKFIPLHSDADLLKFNELKTQGKISNHVQVHRYKGLGEMNPDQLKVCLLDTKTRNLVKIENTTDANKIFELMTSAELKRKLV